MRTVPFLFLIFWMAMTTVVSAQYISSTTVQAGDPVVYPGFMNQSILRIEVEIGPNPVTLTNMEFNTNGSSNPASDITRFKLYYYNDSSSFDIFQATLIGKFESPWFNNFMFLTAPNANYSGMFSFNGLSAGKNYFWLLYDLGLVATVCNFIDAEFSNGSANSVNFVPAVSSPAGSSVIGPCPNGLAENINRPEINIFPIPASDEITLEFEKPVLNPVTIDLLDITGKLIAPLFNGIPEGNLSSLRLPFKNYEPGLYLIRTSYDGKENLSKIVLF